MLQNGVLFENDADPWVFHRLARTSRIPKEGKKIYKAARCPAAAGGVKEQNHKSKIVLLVNWRLRTRNVMV